MPSLILKFKENIIKEYQIEKGKALTMGRRNDNDIVIENLAVSGYHAKIDSVGEGFLLSDIQSKNGTFVNEQKISSHWLKNSDIITIGKHTLSFIQEEPKAQTPNRNQAPAANLEQTMVMSSEKQRAVLSKNPKSASGESQAEAESDGHRGVISFLSGIKGDDFIISKKLIKIGKSQDSDIVIKGLTLGQTAATISRRPNGYYISYVSGFSKVKVNNENIKESILLKEFDIIDIGSNKLQFCLK